MKKIISLLLIFAILLGAAACSAMPKEDSSELKIVCTVFPQYDWIRNILGKRIKKVELTLLMDNGADLHNYQTTVEDMMKISSSDLFVYIGGESDKWVPAALKQTANPFQKAIKLMDYITPLETGSGAAHQHDSEDAHQHTHDEHLWLSLKNATTLTRLLAKELGELDPEYKELYSANAEVYIQKLNQLDQGYQETINGAARKTLLFADRFPFIYLAKDYGLEHIAAFSGCSAEVEVSFSTMAHLIEKIDALQLPYIMVTETGDQELAKTILKKTKDKNQKVLVMNSIQSITASQIKKGIDYLSLMEENLEVLKKALY